MIRALQRATIATQHQRGFKVAVLGAAGGIGQPLSLLLKLNPKVTELSCFDLAPVTPGNLSPESTKRQYGWVAQSWGW